MEVQAGEGIEVPARRDLGGNQQRGKFFEKSQLANLVEVDKGPGVDDKSISSRTIPAWIPNTIGTGQFPLYGVEVSHKANDPAVLGAYLALQESQKPESLENPQLVMAVGNGEITLSRRMCRGTR